MNCIKTSWKSVIWWQHFNFLFIFICKTCANSGGTAIYIISWLNSNFFPFMSKKNHILKNILKTHCFIWFNDASKWRRFLNGASHSWCRKFRLFKETSNRRIRVGASNTEANLGAGVLSTVTDTEMIIQTYANWLISQNTWKYLLPALNLTPSLFILSPSWRAKSFNFVHTT